MLWHPTCTEMQLKGGWHVAGVETFLMNLMKLDVVDFASAIHPRSNFVQKVFGNLWSLIWLNYAENCKEKEEEN